MRLRTVRVQPPMRKKPSQVSQPPSACRSSYNAYALFALCTTQRPQSTATYPLNSSCTSSRSWAQPHIGVATAGCHIRTSRESVDCGARLSCKPRSSGQICLQRGTTSGSFQRGSCSCTRWPCSIHATARCRSRYTDVLNVLWTRSFPMHTGSSCWSWSLKA